MLADVGQLIWEPYADLGVFFDCTKEFCRKADSHHVIGFESGCRMGRAERTIVEWMRQSVELENAWDSARMATQLYPSGRMNPTKIRQTYRVLDRTRTVPDALSLDDLCSRIEDPKAQLEVRRAVRVARKRRMQVSIVQMKEVRLDQWAVTWNNLRLARHWLWLPETVPVENAMEKAVACMLNQHRRPCCLLFDRSAEPLQAELMKQCGDRTESVGTGQIAYVIGE